MERWLEKLIEHEAEYFRMIAEVETTPSAWYLHGRALPEYRDVNRALRLRVCDKDPETVAREVVAHFLSRGLDVVADVDPVAEEQGIGRALRQMGVMPVVGVTLLMAYPHSMPPIPAPSGVEVRVIPNETGAGEARLWVEAAISDDVGTEYEEMWRAVAEHEARVSRCRLYMGLVDGTPAGACDLFLADGLGRIESVATYPAMRRRGVATAVVARAVTDSLASGSEATYLYTEAGGAGEQVYRRLGFEVLGRNVLRRHIGC